MKDIVGYEKLYKVTEDGRVYSTKYGDFIKQHINNSGYCYVQLYNNTVRKTYIVHRLVATAFLVNPDSKPTVNHKDGNRLNNHLNNLEWATYSENLKHKNRVLGGYNTPSRNKKFPKSVSKYFGVTYDKSRGKWVAGFTENKRNIYIGRYSSEIDAAEAYNKYVIARKLTHRKLNIL